MMLRGTPELFSYPYAVFFSGFGGPGGFRKPAWVSLPTGIYKRPIEIIREQGKGQKKPRCRALQSWGTKRLYESFLRRGI